MDWKEIGQLVGPLAPTIGGLVGGFIPVPGGAMLGQMAGKMLADALGVSNDPDSVGAALQLPGAQDRVQAAENEAAAQWPALAEIAKARFAANAAESESIGQTMRAELASGQAWWSWRNLYGYSVAMEATLTTWVILYGIVWDKTVMTNVTASLSFFLSWYTLRFGLLGYIHNGASNEKIAAVTGEAPSIIKTISKAIRSK